MTLAMEDFIDEAALFFHVSRASILGRSRLCQHVRARQVCMYLIREFCEWSLEEIGRRFNRDHATVIWALKSIRNKASTDETLRDQLAYMRRVIRDKLFNLAELNQLKH